MRIISTKEEFVRVNSTKVKMLELTSIETSALILEKLKILNFTSIIREKIRNKLWSRKMPCKILAATISLDLHHSQNPRQWRIVILYKAKKDIFHLLSICTQMEMPLFIHLTAEMKTILKKEDQVSSASFNRFQTMHLSWLEQKKVQPNS